MKLWLSWNGFEQALSNPDNLQWTKYDNSDCTSDVVVTNNNEKIATHRTVLGYGSKYFLGQLEDRRELISVKDEVMFEDLVAMMDFMYTGRCEVEVNHLERFLASAKYLALVGLQPDLATSACDRATKSIKSETVQVDLDGAPDSETHHAKPELQESLRDSFIDDETVVRKPDFKRIYKVDLSKHICEVCKKYFAKGEHLRNHLATHNGERNHKCEKCGKNFSQDSHLRRHLMIHQDLRPYSCHLCEKKFIQGSQLKIHLLRHTGEKPHSCEECGKSYVRLSDFKEHKLVHTGEKPEVCPTCSKTFFSRLSLKKHILTHNKLGKKVCTFCGKSISQGGYFRVHMKIHENGKPHKCSHCDKSFVRSFGLKAHEETHNSSRTRT